MHQVFVVYCLIGIHFVGMPVPDPDHASSCLPLPGISENKRFLVHENGTPFFYLGDTAWELFHRLNQEEADLYLKNRSEKGFTVIQAVVLAELDGLTESNANGDLPFEDMDITRPNEAYFSHVDWIVDRAAFYGLYVGMLPTWGRWVGTGDENFVNETNAREYGKFLAERYQNKPIIWILGGDRPADRTAATWNEMAWGIRDVVGNKQLITFHPVGGQSSTRWFSDATWIDFHMAQSGHSAQSTNYTFIERDYAISNVKPCMDAEPAYEYPPDAMPPNRPVGALQVRRNAYWAVFAGAHGHTYGAHPIWQMYDTGHRPLWDVVTPWHQALDLPGANQLVYLKQLMLSRPFLTRIPDQSILSGDIADGTRRVQATRDGTLGNSDATYIFAYIPRSISVAVNTALISNDTLRVWWLNPRTGEVTPPVEHPNASDMVFSPPAELLQKIDDVFLQKTHVVYSRDARGEAQLYVNGENVASAHIGGDFSNWDSDFRLALGAELSGGRHWQGIYHSVNLYNRALTAEEVAALYRHDIVVEDADIHVRYTFEEGEGVEVFDRSGRTPSLNLNIENSEAVRWHSDGLELIAPTRIATEHPPIRLIDALQESNTITLEAWITPSFVNQEGPARIVTLSADTGSRNFTLGQEQEYYLMRLRSTATCDNGLPALQRQPALDEDWVLIIDDASRGYPAPLQTLYTAHDME